MTLAPPPPRARRWRVLSASVLGTLGLVVAAELALRILRPVEPPAPVAFTKFHPTETRRGLLVDDPDTAYALAPSYRDTPRHAGTYATGAWPYRNAPPRQGVPSVAVLGDSCVYGVGVRASETLPAQIADALSAHGRGPDTVQVLNLGVPGFSSAQVLAELRALLRREVPDQVVLYLAAWNDQSPALVQPDAEILTRRHGFRAWLRTTALSRLFAPASTSAAETAAVLAAWEQRGELLHGPRVTSEELVLNAEQIFAACDAAGVRALLVLPAWPATTLQRFERLAKDRELLRAAAERAGVALLDARGALDAAGLEDARAFVDQVHPSAAAHAVLGAAVASLLQEHLPAAAPLIGLDVRSIEPASTCALGDVELTLAIDGLEPDEVPLVVIGHAPLLDLRALGDGRFAGTLMSDAAGPHDLLVQAGKRAALRPRSITLWEPRVELDREHDRLVLRSRPGDAALVVAATELAPVPALDARGSACLDPAHVVGSFQVRVGDDGCASLPVDLRTVDPEGVLWLQALVTPAGAEASVSSRYGALFDLRAELAAAPARPR